MKPSAEIRELLQRWKEHLTATRPATEEQTFDERNRKAEDYRRRLGELVVEDPILMKGTKAAYLLKRTSGFSEEDVRGVIATGLYRATLKFDPLKSLNFLSYAKKWIKEEFESFRKDSDKTHGTRPLRDQISKLKRVSDRLTQELGKHPTTGEVAKELGTTEKEVRDIVLAQVRRSTIQADHEQDQESKLEEGTLVYSPGGDSDPAALLERKLEAERVGSIVEELRNTNPEEMALAEEHFLEGKTYRELAEHDQKRSQNLRAKMSRFCKKVRIEYHETQS